MANPTTQPLSAHSLPPFPSIDLPPSQQLNLPWVGPPTTAPPLSTRRRSRSRSRPRLGSPLSLPSSPAIPKPARSPVRYHSSILTKLDPSLAFKKRHSVRAAAAAAAADVCRDRFKAERDAAANAVGEAVEGDTPSEADERKSARRRLLNRSSACASRLRKEAYCSGLERELERLEHQFIALQVRARELEAREAEREGKVKMEDVGCGDCGSDAGTGDRVSGGEASRRREADQEEMETSFETDGGVGTKSPENLWPPGFGMNASLFDNAAVVPERSGDWEKDAFVGADLELPPFLL